MSTILKALKRSEASRPREASLPPGQVPDGGTARHRKAGLWVGGVLLFVAGGLAAAWWLNQRPPTETGGGRPGLREIAEVSLPARPSEKPAPSDGGSESAGTEASMGGNETSGGEGSELAEENQPAPGGGSRPGEAGPDGVSAPAARQEPAADEASSPPEQRLERFALLPRIGDLPPERKSELPQLALNAHVHAASPGERFVLINLSRYGEGDRVAPGLTVASIFPGGVVLEDGQGRFVLPRP